MDKEKVGGVASPLFYFEVIDVYELLHLALFFLLSLSSNKRRYGQTWQNSQARSVKPMWFKSKSVSFKMG